MIYYFQFGYRAPENWMAVRADPGFDCESTGVIAIDAATENEARDWGLTLARWYTAQIHSGASGYVWSEDHYAAWVTAEEPMDEDLELVPRVAVGEYPDFLKMRSYLAN